ncbi:MAG TPA: glycosyl hydrolase family 18 protein, partial [Armatimonadota bacterium]
MSDRKHPVFFDHSGKRWAGIMRFATWFALAFSIVGAIFSFSILALPSSPIFLKSTPLLRSKIMIPKLFSKREAMRHALANKERNKLIKQIRVESHQNHKALPGGKGTYSTVVGFYVDWDPQSVQSVRDHISSLSYLVPEWLNLDMKDPHLFKDSKDDTPALKRQNDEVISLCSQHNVPVIPLIHNMRNKAFDWAGLRSFLLNPSAQQKLAINLRDYVVRNKFGGINIDFEPGYDQSKMTPQQIAEAKKLIRVALPKFMVTLSKTFHEAHLLVTQDVPAKSDDFDLAALNDPNDFIVAMLYDEHVISLGQGGYPGTIASQVWLEDMAAKIFRDMDSSKVVLGIGNYCYDWPIEHDGKGNVREYLDANGQPSGEIFYCGQGKLRKLPA